jgi:predicted nucleic acid-binding Zn ribbon protein
VTDGEAFEEPVAPERCPACLAAIEPDQQYCLQCGERLAPVGPEPVSSWRGQRPPATMIVAVGALLLLLGGFGIAYGFTRDDSKKAEGTTTVGTGGSTGAVVPPTFTLTDTNASVPTFTEVVTTGSGGFPTVSVPVTTGTGFPTDTTPTFPTGTDTTATDPGTTTTDPGPEANDWPAGRDAFAVILSSDDTEKFTFASITAKKSQAKAKGFSNAGVLNSDDYFTLNPGYWVLYLGPYASKSDAQAAQARARAGGYPDAYVRRVAE